MKILIHTKNFDLTPSIETLVNEKVRAISRFLKPREDALAEARVEVSKPSKHHHKGFVYYAEINFKIGSRLFRAAEEHIDLEYAVIAARDEIERQLKKFKGKLRDRIRMPV